MSTETANICFEDKVAMVEGKNMNKWVTDDELTLINTSVGSLVTVDLKMCKIAERWVPRMLTQD
jgi:hypothetical protein